MVLEAKRLSRCVRPTLAHMRSVPAAPRSNPTLIAEFDDGDQAHRPPARACCHGCRRGSAILRVGTTDATLPDSYQAILPVVDMPKEGIAFPGRSSSTPSTTSTPEQCSTSRSTSKCSRETEFIRQRPRQATSATSSNNAATSATATTNCPPPGGNWAEYNRLLTANVDERPVEAAFSSVSGR